MSYVYYAQTEMLHIYLFIYYNTKWQSDMKNKLSSFNNILQKHDYWRLN